MAKIRVVVWVVLGLAFAGPAMAQKQAAHCASPRSAVALLLDAQQPDAFDLQLASACMPKSLGKTAAQERAVQIKAVLDSLGLYVRLDDIPAAEANGAEAGLNRYVLFERYPDIYVERVGERWVWSQQTVHRIPVIYKNLGLGVLHRWSQGLPAWLQAEFLGMPLWRWMALISLLLVAYGVRFVVNVLVGIQGKRLMAKLRVSWGEDLLARVGRPLGTLLAAGLVSAVTPLLLLPVRYSQAILLFARVAAAVSAVWALYRAVDLFTAWLQQRADKTDTRLDDQLVPLIRRAIKIFVVALGAIFVLQNLGVDVTGLVAGFSLGGVALALAAKDTLSNLFGSATIFASKPFQIGDSVVINGTSGVIEAVGFRATRIRTFENSLVTIPNNKVADAAVDNFGVRRYRRCKMTLGLTYDTRPEQMQAFVEGVRALIAANPGTRKDSYEVHFNGFGASSLDVLVYFFFDVDNWSDELRHRHDLFLDIMRLAEDLQVRFAFPTQSLHLESVVPPKAPEAKAPQDARALAAIVEAYGQGQRGNADGMLLTHGYYPQKDV